MPTYKCQYCGKPLEMLTTHVIGREVAFGFKPCDCPESRKEQKRAQEIAEKQARDNERKVLKNKFIDAGISERYINENYNVSESILKHAKEGLYIYGPIGTGKTYTAVAVAKNLIKGGASVQFTNSVKLLETIRDTYRYTKSTQAAINKYTRCNYLIIDDLGKENASGDALSILFRIIDERWNACKPTIITSNYSRPELIKKLSEKQSDHVTAVSIVSRLSECFPLELSGKDQRLR